MVHFWADNRKQDLSKQSRYTTRTLRRSVVCVLINDNWAKEHHLVTLKTILQLNKAYARAPVRSCTWLHAAWKVLRNTNSRWSPFPFKIRSLFPFIPSEKHSFWNILVFSSPKPTNQERIRQKTTTASRFGEGGCGGEKRRRSSTFWRGFAPRKCV